MPRHAPARGVRTVYLLLRTVYLLSYEATLVLYRYVVDGVDDAPRGEARASSGASLLHCGQRDA